MRKADCVMIFVCIVFSFFILGAISQGGREQARILTCSASLKQIGAILTIYQADNDGYVPVMRNRWTTVNAKSAFLSLPFRKYSGATVALPTYLNPDLYWSSDKILDYAANYLPDFFVCPFARGNPQATLFQDAGTVVIGGVTRHNYVSAGRMDSYSTWIWPRNKGYDFWPGTHPWGPPNGYNKYENVVWHRAGSPDPGYPDDPYVCSADSPAGSSCAVWMENNPRKFSNVRRLSERTALYCATGEIDDSSHNRIFNYRSHKKGNRGGTNVLFGDTHVEWVQGSQISAGN